MLLPSRNIIDFSCDFAILNILLTKRSLSPWYLLNISDGLRSINLAWHSVAVALIHYTYVNNDKFS